MILKPITIIAILPESEERELRWTSGVLEGENYRKDSWLHM